MTIREVMEQLAQFTAAQEACSREWRMSDAIVMCVELDMSSFARAPTVPPGHSVPRRGSFLRVSFVRFSGAHGVATLTGLDDDSFLQSVSSDAERSAIREHRELLRRWMLGALDVLPQSNSTRVSDQYRR